MPGNFSQWAWFYFFAGGSLVGWLVLFVVAGTVFHEMRHRLPRLPKVRVSITREGP